jgi:predicted permease
MPGFTLVAVLILALGIGATTVIFTVANGVLLRPLSYPEPERLLSVHGLTDTLGEFWGLSNLEIADVRRQSRSLAIAAWTYGGGTMAQPGEPQYIGARQISADLFPVLGVSAIQGRVFRTEEDLPGAPPAAIISQGLSERRFGGAANAVGQTMLFDGKPYEVVGVAPSGFQLDGDADLFIPLGQSTDSRMQNRAARFVHGVARLRPGFSFSDAQAELTLIAGQLAREYPKSNAGLRLRAGALQQELVQDVQATLWLLLSAVGVVLAIACVNIASLQLVRAVSREREFAMRVALGASRSRLVRQCLTESALLGLVGGGLGIVLAALSLRPFVAFWPGSLPRVDDIRLDWHVWLFTLAVSLFSGFLFGLAPAFRVPVRTPDLAIRSNTRTAAGVSPRMHRAFVISEIALAVVLLISAGMLGRTLLALSSLNPGLNVQDVLTARFALSPHALASPDEIRAAWQGVLDRARQVPGVDAVALTDIVPMRVGENTLPYSTAPMPPNEAPVALASSVTPDYLKVMGIPLVSGRFFTEHDRAESEAVIVVDENLARRAFVGDAEAVDKRLYVRAMGQAPIRIIGVVGHVRHWGLAADDQSRVRDQIYYPFAQVPDQLLRFFSTVMSIALRTKVPPLTLVEPLQRQLSGASRDQSLYGVRTMEDLVSASLDRQRFLGLLFGIFGAVALLLACVGIYGVVAYLSSQRVPEFGVRMALGATARDVLGLVLKQSVGLIGAGVAIGSLAAWAAARALAPFVEGMRPTQPATVAVMTSVLVAAAFLASLAPARRASRLDAVQALRQE